jgi:hypothetical protein
MSFVSSEALPSSTGALVVMSLSSWLQNKDDLAIRGSIFNLRRRRPRCQRKSKTMHARYAERRREATIVQTREISGRLEIPGQNTRERRKADDEPIVNMLSRARSSNSHRVPGIKSLAEFLAISSARLKPFGLAAAEKPAGTIPVADACSGGSLDPTPHRSPKTTFPPRTASQRHCELHTTRPAIERVHPCESTCTRLAGAL